MKKRIRNILEEIRKRIFQPFFRKMVGIDKYEEEIQTLYHILNKCVDITTFPKATGLLRQVQLGDTEMLRIFHEICQKHELSYWLDWGTLLGAVRHKGFIPWDDDLDVAMPREDYEKVQKILPELMDQYGIEVATSDERRIGLTIWNAGMIMDVFPMDKVDKKNVENTDKLKTNIRQYRKYYKRNRSRMEFSKIVEKKIAIIGSPEGENSIWYHNPEFGAKGDLYAQDIIFPLKEISFENYSFYAPNNCEKYLQELYGDYMGFPHGGILHHKGSSTTNIHENAAKFAVNMEELIEKLKKTKFNSCESLSVELR